MNYMSGVVKIKKLMVDDKKLVQTYKSYKKEIKLLKVLLKNTNARYRWCKKKNIEYVTDSELQKTLNNYEDNLFLLSSFIYKG